jgi:hypothetical protein
MKNNDIFLEQSLKYECIHNEVDFIDGFYICKNCGIKIDESSFIEMQNL